MRTRPNQLIIPQAPGKNPNSIYSRYRKIFQYLLDQRSKSIEQNEYSKYYVSMPDTHRDLYQAVTTIGDSMRCFLGFTGIGKSTILRYVFKMNGDNPVIRDVPVPKTVSDTFADQGDVGEEDQLSLFIPLFMNERHIIDTGQQDFIAASSYFADQLAAASLLLQGREKIQFDESEFASFVLQQRSDLLQKDKSLALDAPVIARVRSLRTVYPFAFEMMRLKWFLTKSPIKRVILIIDDVESLPLAHQESICHVIAKSFEWLINLNNLKRTWIGNAIISVRPLTYNMIRQQDWFNALYFDQPIGVKTPPDLKAIFEKRFNDACEELRITEDVRKSDNWTAARNVFDYVYDKLARDRSNFLVELSNYNVRHALTQFETILLNRNYFEPDYEVQERPNLQVSTLNFSEAAALKALGMGEGTVFPCLGTQLSNIFVNQIEPYSDLLGTLLILAIHCIGRPLSPHGIKYTGKNELLRLLDSVCCLTDDQKNYLPQLIKDLNTLGLIQVVSSGKNNNQTEVVELMPKALAIWKSMRQTSVLTEMFRDDTFVNYTHLEDGGPSCTQALPNDLSRLEAAITFAGELSLAERNLVERCVRVHGGTRWVTTFGPVAVSRTLLDGINRSIRVLIDGGSMKETPHGLSELKRRVEQVETAVSAARS